MMDGSGARKCGIGMVALLFGTAVSFACEEEGSAPLGVRVEPGDQICFVLYAVQDRTLKMTAHLYPLREDDSRKVFLELNRDDAGWEKVAEGTVRENKYGSPPGAKAWNVLLRVEHWDSSRDWRYRVVALEGAAHYEGIVRKDPVEKDEIVVFAFTGNSVNPGHGGGISKKDIVDNVLRVQPDLLFFSGDQVYHHREHYKFWMKFGEDFGEATRSTPAITIPDDHDVGQPNLWGEAARRASKLRGAADGGYVMPPQYVKEVEFAQTAHLPDPYDPTPVGMGIGVYYTSLRVGGIDFAILEDRKFKTGPAGIVPKMGPRPDHVTDPKYDPRTVDVKEAKLLGARQLKFLEAWGRDWRNAEMKAVLSQTIFCGGAHLHGKIGGRLHADMDSNGWPQAGRNRAVAAIRKSFSFHLAGDQHLGTIFSHGIDDWNDSMYSFCVPSIANLYLRWWRPLEPGKNRVPGAPEYTGEYLDGFGNKITCWAAANPDRGRNGGDKLTTRAAGFGEVRFNKKTREITMICWPRNVDVTSPEAKPYPGWPKTIRQEDNYGRKAVAHLPTLIVEGMEDPVVQVIEEATGEVLYTLRIKGRAWRPKVFAEGRYTVIVGDQGERSKTLPGLEASDKPLEMRVSF